MKTRPLGRTGLFVTTLGLGTMTWGSQNTEAEGHAQIDMALDAGLNLMDTAELYAVPGSPETSGRTETIIGNWFKASGKRENWILASKVGGGGTPFLRGGRMPDGASIKEAVEGSLIRLRTDRLDLYQIHWAGRGHFHFGRSWDYAPERQNTADAVAGMLEALEAMGRLVDEGKIRHFGVSNETAWGLMKWVELAERRGLPRLASVQNEYSLLQRHFDLDMAELAHHEEIGLLAYSSLAAGVLSGKYLGGAVPTGSRAEYQGGLWRLSGHSEPAVAAYVALAQAHGLDPAQMAIAFCLTRPFMTSVLLGATSVEQLRNGIGAAELVLSKEVLDGIAAIHRAYPRPI